MSQLSQVVAPSKGAKFPKTARLLHSRDFKFADYKRLKWDGFHVLVSPHGKGRLGVSISKKVLKRSVWRNRVKRLVKEAFRLEQANLKYKDIHFIGQPKLLDAWETLRLEDVQSALRKAAQ